jgi:hypothetical protein
MLLKNCMQHFQNSGQFLSGRLELHIYGWLLIWSSYDSQDLVLAQIMCRPASFKIQFSTVVHYTKEKQGTIPSVYIKTSIDQTLPPASQDYIIKACPQTEVVEIQADHTPMFCATDELHEILLRLAAKYTSALTKAI